MPNNICSTGTTNPTQNKKILDDSKYKLLEFHRTFSFLNVRPQTSQFSHSSAFADDVDEEYAIF